MTRLSYLGCGCGCLMEGHFSEMIVNIPDWLFYASGTFILDSAGSMYSIQNKP